MFTSIYLGDCMMASWFSFIFLLKRNSGYVLIFYFILFFVIEFIMGMQESSCLFCAVGMHEFEFVVLSECYIENQFGSNSVPC